MTLACFPCNLLRWVWNDMVNCLAIGLCPILKSPSAAHAMLAVTSSWPCGNSSPLKMHHFRNPHFLKFSQKSQELSSNLNLKEDAVEGSVGVMTLSGVPLAVISLHLIPILHPHVLRDSRVPRMELFSTHCCYYDSACQSRHEEARTSRSQQDTEAGCWWFDLTSSSDSLPPLTPHTCHDPPGSSFLSLQFSGSPNVF